MRIVIDPTHRVLVVGRFAPVVGEMEEGRIEQIIFANETVTSGAELNSLM